MLLFLSYRELVLFQSCCETLFPLNYDDLMSPLLKHHPPTAIAKHHPPTLLLKHHYTSQHTQHDNPTPILLF